MIKLVVFDWNGVLLSDARVCAEANNDVLRAYGHKPISFAAFQETMTVPVIDFYVQHGIARETLMSVTDNSSEIFQESYERRASKARTRRSARRLLSFLSEQSIELIILSDHTVSGVESQLQRLDLKRYFSHVLANTDGNTSLRSRNKQAKLEAFLKEGAFRRNEVLIIGDSPQEVEAGKYLGITTVAITGGFFATKRLKGSKPDYLISNLSELIGVIEKFR